CEGLPRWTYPCLVHGARALGHWWCGGQGVDKLGPTGESLIRSLPSDRCSQCRCRVGCRQRKVHVFGHLSELLPRRLRPALPLWQLRRLAADVDIHRRDDVAAFARDQSPMWANFVVAAPECSERISGLRRRGIEVPVHFLGFQRLMKALEESELRRRAVLDAHMRIVAVDVTLE